MEMNFKFEELETKASLATYVILIKHFQMAFLCIINYDNDINLTIFP